MNNNPRMAKPFGLGRSRLLKVRKNVLVLVCLGLLALGLAACGGAPPVPTAAPTALPVADLTAVNPTPTLPAVTPQPIAGPQPTPCPLVVQPALAAGWQADVLGCPITAGAAAINTAYAPFEGGEMLWRGDTDTIYVLTQDGRWMSYANEWREGDPEFSCGEADSLTTPIRGFGRVWCDHSDVQQALGAITAAEIGDNASAVQEFENGTILTAPFGDLFVLEGEAGAWRMVDITQ